VSQVEVGKIERYEIVCAVLNFVCYHDVVVTSTGVGCDIGQDNLRIPAHTITGGLEHELYASSSRESRKSVLGGVGGSVVILNFVSGQIVVRTFRDWTTGKKLRFRRHVRVCRRCALRLAPAS
jgi:hypothetical protein